MTINKLIVFIAFFSLFCAINITRTFAQGTGCAAGYDCSPRGVAEPGTQCGNGEWESLLVTAESGGDYSLAAPNSSALGRYQFIDDTRAHIGGINNLPCASGAGSREGFASCPGLQDDYARALWAQDRDTLMSNPSVASAVASGTVHECPVTESGLVAMAHNVGAGCAALWAQGGQALMYAEGPTFSGVPAGTPPCTDANGTNPIERYACAMGGYDLSNLGGGGPGSGAIGAGCGFGFTPGAPGPHASNTGLIGCDEDIYEQGADRVDALMQQQFEAANAVITQPTPVEQLTCFDQTTQLFSGIGGIFSDPESGNIDDTIVPNVQQPLMASMEQFLNGNIMGGVNDVINQAFSSLTGGLMGGGPGGGGDAGNCDMMEQSWLISQCIEMPQIPSLGDILGGQIGELTGALGGLGNIADLANPERLLEQVCSAGNDMLQGAFGDLNSSFEGAAEGIMNPITDRVGDEI